MDDASALVPQVAFPHSPDNDRDIDQAVGQPLDIAYIGACTGAKYHDLALVAEVLRGRRIHADTPLLIAPASQEVFARAERDGIAEVFRVAGATFTASSCGACLGVGPNALKANIRCISSANRNFRGRMGSSESEVYLASPATVAASAIEGKVADPRIYLHDPCPVHMTC